MGRQHTFPLRKGIQIRSVNIHPLTLKTKIRCPPKLGTQGRHTRYRCMHLNPIFPGYLRNPLRYHFCLNTCSIAVRVELALERPLGLYGPSPGWKLRRLPCSVYLQSLPLFLLHNPAFGRLRATQGSRFTLRLVAAPAQGTKADIRPLAPRAHNLRQ